ncbi:MAG: hypothetical protein K9J25_02960 [Bacteroidales bacterium]|nr:hypothetical protein [Bacteroidales bacterium]
MSYTKYIRALLFTLILYCLVTDFSTAQKNIFLKPVRVEKGSYVNINDSLVYFNKDTVIYVSNSYMPEDTNAYKQTIIFYDSLKARAQKKKFTSFLYDIVVIPPARLNPSKINKKNIDNFADHDGKRIRHIYVKRLNVFGTTVADPESSLKNEKNFFLNKTHIKTREAVIRSYLIFDENDTLTPNRLSESERLLRKLPYIYDARIIIVPVSREDVDIMVITKDVYSLGLMTEIHGYNVGKVSLFEKNMVGLGHELQLEVPYDYRKYNSAGFSASYEMKNISQTMIDAKLSYRNAFMRRIRKVEVKRDFLTAYTQYAGGISIRESNILEDLDTLLVPEPVESSNIDFWLGRSFLLNDINFTRAVISARYVNNNVWERPEISSNSYYRYQKYNLYLASLSFVSQRFYKANLIYNYGRNEDIPYGGMLEMTYGKEYNEFSPRDYFSIKSAFGSFVPGAGYFYGRGQVSAFVKNNMTEQGLLNFNLNYISDLYDMKSYKLRLFATLDYKRGFFRFDDEYLFVRDGYGIRGFKNDSIKPDQRIYLNLETVAFSKMFVYGFRLAFFGFADMVLYSRGSRFYEYQNMVSGFGIGLRVRNDNLVFNTFQIRFGIYPGAPPGSILQHVDVEGERLLDPPGFDPGPPGITKFR